MGTNNNKFIAMLKRNYSTIIIGALALVLLFVPEAKAMMQQGLMKLGLFEPKLEKVEEIELPKEEKTEPEKPKDKPFVSFFSFEQLKRIFGKK